MAVRTSREILIAAPPDHIMDAWPTSPRCLLSPGHRRAQVLDTYEHSRPHHVRLAVRVLTSHGLQRITSHVLAALLFTEQSTMTAGELADRLAASAGAISGADARLGGPRGARACTGQSP